MLQSLVGYQIRRADIVMRQAFAREVGEPYQLTPVQLSVLVLLSDDARLTHKQLSEALAVAPSNMVAVVATLRKRSLIQRTRNPDDGRSVLVQLTEVGRELTAQALAAIERMEARIFADSAPGARAQLIELLGAVRAHAADRQ